MDKGWALIPGRALTKGGGGRLSQRWRSLAEIGYLAMFGFIINNTTQGKKMVRYSSFACLCFARAFKNLLDTVSDIIDLI